MENIKLETMANGKKSVRPIALHFTIDKNFFFHHFSSKAINYNFKCSIHSNRMFIVFRYSIFFFELSLENCFSIIRPLDLMTKKIIIKLQKKQIKPTCAYIIESNSSTRFPLYSIFTQEIENRIKEKE